MSSAELTEWMAFEQVDGPLGPRRSDYHAALIATTFANGVSALGGKRGNRKIGDFLIEWDARRPMSAEEMLRQVQSLNRALGGKEVTSVRD